jgi:hypothetical protein
VILGSILSSGEDGEERVHLENMISCALWGVALGANPSVMYHNNSANTFPVAALKCKDGAARM